MNLEYLRTMLRRLGSTMVRVLVASVLILSIDSVLSADTIKYGTLTLRNRFYRDCKYAITSDEGQGWSGTVKRYEDVSIPNVRVGDDYSVYYQCTQEVHLFQFRMSERTKTLIIKNTNRSVEL